VQLLMMLEEQLVERARNDPNCFIEFLIRKKQIPMHREWQDLVSQHKRVIILGPRGHGKTTQIAVFRVLWELGRNPDLRVKIACATERRARDVVLEIAKHIERNKRLWRVFPHLRPPKDAPWTREQIYVEREVILKDASVEACGILGSPTGSRADFLVCDDVCDYKNTIREPSKRSALKDSFFGNWIELLDGPEAKVVYIATLWHEDDLTSTLLDTPGYVSKIYSIDEDFNPLWEEKFPKDVLIEKFRERGSFYFDRAYRNKAVSEEDRLFPVEVLQRCVSAPPSEQFLKGCEFFSGVDLAIGKSQRSGYTVIFTIAVDEAKVRYPVEIKRARMTSPETVRALIATVERFRPKIICVENNFYQQALIDWVSDLAGVELPIEPYFTGGQKSDPSIGIPSLSAEFQNRQWCIPIETWHEDGCPCVYCVWLEEMRKFPDAKYDDTVMACWLAREAARRFSSQVGGFAVWEI